MALGWVFASISPTAAQDLSFNPMEYRCKDVLEFFEGDRSRKRELGLAMIWAHGWIAAEKSDQGKQPESFDKGAIKDLAIVFAGTCKTNPEMSFLDATEKISSELSGE